MSSPSALEQMSGKIAIDNLHRVGAVGRTTSKTFLWRHLPHCTAEQLEHIETETAKHGRDLNSITDKLWRKHYGRRFGEADAKDVEERLRRASLTGQWRKLYKAKLKELQENLETVGVARGVDRLRELYQLQNAKKRQIQVVDMDCPDSCKRRNSSITAERSIGGHLESKSRKKTPTLKAGMTSKVELEQKSTKAGGLERGRLWRKSFKIVQYSREK